MPAIHSAAGSGVLAIRAGCVDGVHCGIGLLGKDDSAPSFVGRADPSAQTVLQIRVEVY